MYMSCIRIRIRIHTFRCICMRTCASKCVKMRQNIHKIYGSLVTDVTIFDRSENSAYIVFRVVPLINF